VPGCLRKDVEEMPRPTYEDANVMLRLVQSWPTEASNWIHGANDELMRDYEAFSAKYPPGSEEAGYVHTVLNWYETIGTLYKHGLINEDLLFDWLAVRGAWDELESHALHWREETGEPRLYENFEAMAKAQAKWAGDAQRSLP
jgi:hypothetical protein